MTSIYYLINRLCGYHRLFIELYGRSYRVVQKYHFLLRFYFNYKFKVYYLFVPLSRLDFYRTWPRGGPPFRDEQQTIQYPAAKYCRVHRHGFGFGFGFDFDFGFGFAVDLVKRRICVPIFACICVGICISPWFPHCCSRLR